VYARQIMFSPYNEHWQLHLICDVINNWPSIKTYDWDQFAEIINIMWLYDGPRKTVTKFYDFATSRILIDFQNWHTHLHSNHPQIPPHLRHVATLPCKISVFKNRPSHSFQKQVNITLQINNTLKKHNLRGYDNQLRRGGGRDNRRTAPSQI